MSQVNTELGLSSTAAISLNASNVRSLAGVPSGAISMSNLHGKSAVTFNFADGEQIYQTGSDFANYTLTSSVAGTWQLTQDGGINLNASPGSGVYPNQLSIYFSANRESVDDMVSWYVSVTAGGVTRTCTVYLTIGTPI